MSSHASTAFSDEQAMASRQQQTSGDSNNNTEPVHGTTVDPNGSVSSSVRSNASQQGGSSNNLNFFRKLVRHRANDYHTDAGQTSERAGMGNENEVGGALSGRSVNSRSQAGGGNHGSRSSIMAGDQLWDRMVSCCSARKRIYFFRNLLQNKFWRSLIIVCSVILLFGAQIRTLATDSRADNAWDGIFIGVMVVFLFEIAMRIDVEPNYFVFNPGCFGVFCRRRQDNSAAPAANNPGAIANDEWTCGSFKLGSFLFWCELASTLALLHEISFIHQSNFNERKIGISLDSSGIPVSGMDKVNESSPIEYQEYSLLFTIAKTARVARFIRSTTAMKLSSRVNFYWFWNVVNPFWYWNKIHAALGRQPPATRSGSVTRGSDRSLAMSEREASDTNLNASRPGLVRSASWGGLGLGTLALVQAQSRKEQEEKERDKGFFGPFKKVLRKLGMMRRSDEAWKRNVAAIKIQRAWRAAKYHNDEIHDTDHSERDFAWKARSSVSARNIPGGRPTLSGKHGSGGPGRSQERMGGMLRSQGFSRATPHSHIAYSAQRGRSESQVGSAMRELTGQRVAIGIILALVLTVLFTYTENDATRPTTMVVLHNQTANEQFANQSIQAARDTSAEDLFEYTFANGVTEYYEPTDGESTEHLRDREILRITVTDSTNNETIGLFSNRNEARQAATVSLLSTIFIILVWFFGVTAFVGPVMVLVVIPIERMVRLLGMLTLDPLGYQSTSRYKKFVAEEDEITKNTRWTKEILRGMETSFLMLTILRIGSLMKVGFGSAGVEIIRNNLEKSQTKNTLLLNEKGLTVSCIFLFCDIRQFTDATECLQEEVFVFTNQIAAVVHSICHSYGGSANKNIGDAFLLSWRLEDADSPPSGVQSGQSGTFGLGRSNKEHFFAKHNQADKALLSVVKICMALHHDEYYIEKMSETAREALLAKLAKRKGPVVQLGFGLHAGKAVQGAIGSQRKIDATYVSEAVERAEFLESSTKKYGVKMLMSDAFHRLLHPNNRRRCRKIDQIMMKNDDDDDDDESGEIMELLTFDMDIDALWRTATKPSGSVMGKSDGGHESDNESDRALNKTSRKIQNSSRQLSGGKLKGRRLSVRVMGGMKEPSEGDPSDREFMPGAAAASTASNADLTGDDHHQHNSGPPELVLPKGPAMYNASVWVSEDMRRIRQLYSDGIFFQKFNSGLNSYYSRDWEHARQCFVTILERFEDGPSRYFLTQIETNNGRPPRNFQPYGSG